MAETANTRTRSAPRKTLGSDPLDALVPDGAQAAKSNGRANGSRGKGAGNGPAKPSKVEKVRATFHVPKEVLDSARDAAYWTPGVTLASLCENALRAEIAKLVKKRGEPFPQRESELVGGRPIGS